MAFSTTRSRNDVTDGPAARVGTARLRFGARLFGRRNALILAGAIVIVYMALGILAPVLAPSGPLAGDSSQRLSPPSAAHLLAEDFLVPLKAMKRATLVGMPTAGSTGQPLMVPLYGAHARILHEMGPLSRRHRVRRYRDTTRHHGGADEG